MPASLYVSHDSALAYWRTNPARYVLEGGERNIRSLREGARTAEEFRVANLSELDFGCPPVHILVDASSPPRCPDGYRLHKQYIQLPNHALYPLWDGVHVVSPELCFVQMCHALSLVEAFELGMEFCGTYALRPGSLEGMVQREYALIDATTLPQRLKSWRGLPGLPRARRVAKYLVGGSASPMETKLYLMLCLPLQYGGRNFGRPTLNATIELTPSEREILRVAKVKPDMLWRDKKLIVEYDGRYHEGEEQSKYDALRATILEGRGYEVRRVMRHQMNDPLAFDALADSIGSYLGVRERPATAKHLQARDNLRKSLF
ncbi:MAG: DUF559 domain-containing protein [Eggerthellaceae bacterium]|nr:DUF559 domain-containing protein [Eggerthellaceae bacterium]